MHTIISKIIRRKRFLVKERIVSTRVYEVRATGMKDAIEKVRDVKDGFVFVSEYNKPKSNWSAVRSDQ